MVTPMQTWTSSSPGSKLSESLLPSLKDLRDHRQIRRNLMAWVTYLGLRPARHHRLLLQSLQQIAEGRIDRLAVFMPPGSAKSTYASILFPAWYLAYHLAKPTPGPSQGQQQASGIDAVEHSRDPARQASTTPTTLTAVAPRGGALGVARLDRARNVLAASHTTELATRFGRRVRNIVAEHGATLGLELSEDSAAADRWALSEACGGSEYYAAGVDTGIAGFRADLAIIDDPVRSRADAESSTLRDRQWEWYKSDLLPRLRPGAAIVLIMTRWHEDDLAGRILAEASAGRGVSINPSPGRAE